jgi:hypothetical protein
MYYGSHACICSGTYVHTFDLPNICNSQYQTLAYVPNSTHSLSLHTLLNTTSRIKRHPTKQLKHAHARANVTSKSYRYAFTLSVLKYVRLLQLSRTPLTTHIIIPVCLLPDRRSVSPPAALERGGTAGPRTIASNVPARMGMLRL